MKQTEVWRRRAARQAGFSLLEVSIVSAIVLLIAMFAVPALGQYIIENKVPRVAETVLRFAVRLRVGAEVSGELPYAGLDTSVLATAMRESGALSVSGADAGAKVQHGLGGGARGLVSLMPAAVGGASSGSAFALRFEQVSHAACPALASVMQQVAHRIQIESPGRHGVVKDADASPPLAYQPLQAASYCAKGDVNTFVFVVS